MLLIDVCWQQTKGRKEGLGILPTAQRSFSVRCQVRLWVTAVYV
jgi:hypothetical protein